jgi:hypothetical protein
METAALVISIFAVLLTVVVAGFGILIQFLTHKATSEQSERVADSVAQFRADMQGLVGELKGITDTLVGVQREQFDRMLEAFVTKPGAAAEVAERTGESAERLQQISDAMEALKEEIRGAASADEVQHKLDELAGRLEAVSASTAQAARLAQAAAQPATGAAGRGGVRLVTEPKQIGRGGQVRLRIFGASSPLARIRCEVTAPDGSTLVAWFGDAPAALPFQGLLLVFPDHFEAASTDTPGAYQVAVYRISALSVLAALGAGEELLCTGSFLVENGPRP